MKIKNPLHNLPKFIGALYLDRKIRQVGIEYKNLITQWQDVLARESFGLHILKKKDTETNV